MYGSVEEKFARLTPANQKIVIDLVDKLVPTAGGKKMAQNYLTDAQVEQEIERLKRSPMVALARKEQRIRYQRRQVLYNLRNLEKKGKELAAAGVTQSLLDELARDEVEAWNE